MGVTSNVTEKGSLTHHDKQHTQYVMANNIDLTNYFNETNLVKY